MRAAGIAAMNWLWDLRHGVETRSHVPAMTGDGCAYEPMGLWHIRAALKHLNWRWSSCTFIDMGSGKGRPVFYAATYPFKQVIGVEYNAGLHAIAEQNRRRYRGRLRAPITFRCGDARAFAWPADPLVVLFANPFHVEVMQAVVDRLRASLREHPRPCALLCAGEYTARDPLDRWHELRQQTIDGCTTLYHFSYAPRSHVPIEPRVTPSRSTV